MGTCFFLLISSFFVIIVTHFHGVWILIALCIFSCFGLPVLLVLLFSFLFFFRLRPSTFLWHNEILEIFFNPFLLSLYDYAVVLYHNCIARFLLFFISVRRMIWGYIVFGDPVRQAVWLSFRLYLFVHSFMGVLVQNIDIFKELTPRLRTYELCDQGKNKIKLPNPRQTKHLTLSYKNYL